MAAATDAVAAYGTAKTAYDDRQDGVRWCPDRGDRRDVAGCSGRSPNESQCILCTGSDRYMPMQMAMAADAVTDADAAVSLRTVQTLAAAQQLAADAAGIAMAAATDAVAAYGTAKTAYDAAKTEYDGAPTDGDRRDVAGCSGRKPK